MGHSHAGPLEPKKNNGQEGHETEKGGGPLEPNRKKQKQKQSTNEKEKKGIKGRIGHSSRDGLIFVLQLAFTPLTRKHRSGHGDQLDSS